MAVRFLMRRLLSALSCCIKFYASVTEPYTTGRRLALFTGNKYNARRAIVWRERFVVALLEKRMRTAKRLIAWCDFILWLPHLRNCIMRLLCVVDIMQFGRGLFCSDVRYIFLVIPYLWQTLIVIDYTEHMRMCENQRERERRIALSNVFFSSVCKK